MFKYQQLSERLSQQIASGQLAAGERLPSLRQYARRHGVSINTANRIFEQLESRGLIISKSKTGFFVRGHAELPVPQLHHRGAVLVTENKSDILTDIQRSVLRKDVVNLGAGVVSHHYLPLTELQRALRRTSKRHTNALSSYGDPAGEISLRRAIAELMARRLDHTPSAGKLMITNGCMEAVSLCVQTLSKPDDIVGIFTPCYNGLLMMLQQLGRRVLEIPCGSTGPDLDYLEQLLQENALQCLVFSAIAFNPLGFSMTPEAKQRMAKLAQQYDVPFVEDDTFGELAYPGTEKTPVYAYDTAGMVHYCSSFSKNLSPGFRIGWVATRHITERLVQQKMALNLSCHLSGQYALADYLFSGDYSAHILRLTDKLERATARMHEAVAQYFPEGTAVVRPSGGFFLWIQLPEPATAMPLYQSAAQQNIIIAPGDIFSLASLHNDKIRISCAQPWDASIEQAVKVLGGLTSTSSAR